MTLIKESVAPKIKRIKRLVLLWSVLMALDIITTWVLMTLYGTSEAVPTSRWLIDQGWVLFASVKMASVVITGVLLTWAVKMKPSMYNISKTSLVAVCAFYVTPFVWNMYGIIVMNGWVNLPDWL